MLSHGYFSVCWLLLFSAHRGIPHPFLFPLRRYERYVRSSKQYNKELWMVGPVPVDVKVGGQTRFYANVYFYIIIIPLLPKTFL